MNNFIAGILAVVIIAGLVLGPLGIRFSPEQGGSHTGFITAVDQEGYLFPNYVVFVKTDNSSSQEDRYCVDRRNKQLGEQLKELSKTRKLVTINYEGVRGFGIDLCMGEEIRSVSIHE